MVARRRRRGALMLFVVPTPLGNLEDMTARSLRVLKESKVVFCEDTRRTRNLMSHFGLGIPLERYDENDPRSVDKLLERVRRGDAGRFGAARRSARGRPYHLVISCCSSPDSYISIMMSEPPTNSPSM